MLEVLALNDCHCSREIPSSAQYHQNNQDDEESAPARDSHVLSTTSCKRDKAQELIGRSGSSESARRRVLLALDGLIVVVGSKVLFEYSESSRWCIVVKHSVSHQQGRLS